MKRKALTRNDYRTIADIFLGAAKRIHNRPSYQMGACLALYNTVSQDFVYEEVEQLYFVAENFMRRLFETHARRESADSLYWGDAFGRYKVQVKRPGWYVAEEWRVNMRLANRGRVLMLLFCAHIFNDAANAKKFQSDWRKIV